MVVAAQKMVLGVLPNMAKGFRLDGQLMAILVFLLSLGVVMVASSSMDLAYERHDDPWFFLKRQLMFLGIGLVFVSLLLVTPLSFWASNSLLLLCLAIAALIVVLIPGVGRVVNGSQRWLPVGPVAVQASEFAKFCLLVFFASFLSRHDDAVRNRWTTFFMMIFVMVFVASLLLLEPDFGGAVMITLTLAAMMFIAGVPIIRFLMLSTVGIASLGLLAVISPYRWQRIVAFMDPWSQQFEGGYQLVQSLIAFGRGEWFGMGLGNSLQKQFFLPEAHTDFIFSIYAEEFGFLGVLVLVATYVCLVIKLVLVAHQALRNDMKFAGFFCFGVAWMMGIQAFTNMFVSSGLLPTKGLTLPFMSYGGSSLLVSLSFIAIVLRINIEIGRLNHSGGRGKTVRV